MSDSPSIPTRPSLLERLKRYDDREGWQRFYDIYWRLIYNFARQRGLEEADAEEAVQDTLIAVAAQLPDFQYNPKRCAFKSWLLTLTNGKVVDRLRRRYRRQARESPLDELQLDGGVDAAPVPADLLALWNDEWRQHLWEAARRRLLTNGKVSAQQWQVFDYRMRQGKSPSATAKATGYSLASVPVVCFRVGRLVKAELKRLEREVI